MPSRTQSRTRQERPPAGDTSVVRFDAKQQAGKLAEALEARRDQIAGFLGGDAKTADRFVAVAIDSVVRGGDLLQADLLSLVNSIRHAAIMGLEPTSVMGEGAIVVYRDTGQGKKIAQFQPMVRGLAKLARNSGEVASVGCDVVRKNDHFVFRSGSDPVIEHEPYIKGFTGEDDPGDVIGAYAFAKLRSGELVPLFMSTAEIHKRRAVSKQWQGSNQQTSIWATWPEEMMKKTVLRRLLVEKVPLSAKATVALALDAEIDKPDGDPEKVEARVSRMQRRLLDVGELDAGENGAQGSQDGSGQPEGDAAGTDTAKPDSGAQAALESDGEVSEICGRPGLSEGVTCESAAGHPGPHHAKSFGEWL